MTAIDTPTPAGRARRRAAVATLATLLALHPLAAQEPRHEHEHDAPDTGHPHGGLHFTHPLFAESISPDTKLRMDFASADPGAGQTEGEMELEGEVALAPFFSIEAGVHIDPQEWRLGETHVLAKLTNGALEEAGVILGYGLEVGLPTGAGHEHGPEPGDTAREAADIYEIAPFLNAGWMRGPWELTGWTRFEFPTNQPDQEEVGTELGYNASLLYHAGGRVDLLAEAFGHTGLSGPEMDRSVAVVAPGLRLRPLAGRPLVIGGGAAFPLTSDRDFDSRLLVSAFWHF